MSHADPAVRIGVALQTVRKKLIARTMALTFPNHSRSYDTTRRAVRFWGYDSAMEWSFFVTEEALKRVHPTLVQDEAGMLGAFDANRDRICAAATRLYLRGRKGSYELGAADIP
jgi:hypothetical protein